MFAWTTAGLQAATPQLKRQYLRGVQCREFNSILAYPMAKDNKALEHKITYQNVEFM